MEQHTYRYLTELSGSDYQIVEGEPDIRGWEVKSESGAYIGEVDELLFDPQATVSYLVVHLDDNDMAIRDKKDGTDRHCTPSYKRR